jgi:hypothetical protein
MNYIETVYTTKDVAVFLMWGDGMSTLSEARKSAVLSRLADLPPGGEWRNLRPLSGGEPLYGSESIYAVDYYVPATEVE